MIPNSWLDNLARFKSQLCSAFKHHSPLMLGKRYKADDSTEGEIDAIIRPWKPSPPAMLS